MSQIVVTEPDLVLHQTDPAGAWSGSADHGVTAVLTAVPGGGPRIDVAAVLAVSRVMLHWRRTIPYGVLILGDAWERTYGDLQWRGIQPERVLPWSVLVHDPTGGTTVGWGVEVRGGAFAAWTVDPQGVSLWLDLRSGGSAVRPGDRPITAAVIRTIAGEQGPSRCSAN